MFGLFSLSFFDRVYPPSPPKTAANRSVINYRAGNIINGFLIISEVGPCAVFVLNLFQKEFGLPFGLKGKVYSCIDLVHIPKPSNCTERTCFDEQTGSVDS